MHMVNIIIKFTIVILNNKFKKQYKWKSFEYAIKTENS
jgi:hypothetical protein